MKRETETPEIQEPQQWRDGIDQTFNPRTLSSQGRRRVARAACQLVLFIAFGCVLTWAGWEISRTLMDDARPLGASLNLPPLREVVLITDGVLEQQWVEDVLAIKKGHTLMDLDLYALRDRLLRHSQIRSVELRRDAPDTLVVAIQERLPVVRIVGQANSENRVTLFVARDGVVYEGINYQSLLTDSLPFLDGVRLVRNSHGALLPLHGMEDVALLLNSIQSDAPHLYRNCQVVSLVRLEDYGEIMVKMREIPEVLFDRRGDYTRQLARLDYIVDYLKTQPSAQVRRVNLALGGQVPVELTSPVNLSNAPLQPSKKSKTRRDL